MRVYSRSMKLGGIVLVDERIINMLDNDAVDGRSGHTWADGPFAGKLPGVFWASNVMALHVMPVSAQKIKKLVRYLEGIPIMEAAGEYNDVPEDTGEEETEEA